MRERQLDSAATVPASRSVTDLLQDTATHTENVVRGEIRLAVVKLQDQVTVKAKQALFMLAGGVLGFVAFVVLLVAGIMRLSYEVDPWLATAIAGLLVAIAAVVLVLLPTQSNGGAS